MANFLHASMKQRALRYALKKGNFIVKAPKIDSEDVELFPDTLFPYNLRQIHLISLPCLFCVPMWPQRLILKGGARDGCKHHWQ